MLFRSTASGHSTFTDAAPGAAYAFGQLVSVRPSGVHDELLRSPAVRAYAAQVGRPDGPDEATRAAFDQETGKHRDAVAHMVWIGEVTARLQSALDGLFGDSVWPEPRRHPVADVGVSVGEMNLAVADLHTPAVTTDEGRDALTSLAEAVRSTPSALPEGVVARAREHLTDEQAVEIGRAHV